MNSMAPVEKPQAGSAGRLGLPLGAGGEFCPLDHRLSVQTQDRHPEGPQEPGTAVAPATFFRLLSFPRRGGRDGGRCFTREETVGQEG